MQLWRAVAPGVPAFAIVPAIFTVVAHAAEETRSVSIKPLAPADLKASFKPRGPGSKDTVPYLGHARLDWAYRVLLPGARVERANVEMPNKVHLRLDSGRCIQITNSIVGKAIAAHAVDESCPASWLPRASSQNRFAGKPVLLASTRAKDYTVWTTEPGVSIVRDERKARELAKLPIDVWAVGSLPGLHNDGTALTFFGARGAEFNIISVTTPPAGSFDDY